jgi:CDP-4-dehydro-6-deoxyglucose reductase, E1
MTLPRYIPNYDNFIPGKTPVIYSGPYWDRLEIEAAIKALTEGVWLTAGETVARFQNEFSRKFNVRHSHMVNSGSSANLVMIAAVKARLGWKDGDEIIVSPVGFPTTIAPIVQNGLKPIFADIEMDTLNFDLAEVAAEITEKTVAIFVSPVLGNPPNISRLKNIIDEYGLIKILGDNCDSLGTRWRDRLWTDFCYATSCSFYPAHHISTGEGGMVSSNDSILIDLIRSFSSWGRACYCVGAANLLPCGTCNKRFSNWLGGDQIVDHKYIFDNMGYNLKPLDLQGAIGIEQLKKFDEIESKRKSNLKVIAGFFADNPRVRIAATEEGSDPSWFGVPLICDSAETKRSLVAHFEKNLIQTREYFAGNILRHPGYKHLGNAADYPNAEDTFKRVFFIGCAPQYTSAVLDYVGKVVREW